MKRAAILAVCLLLAGCGFHPLYGSATAPQLASVFVEPIAERDGYEMRNQLIDLFNSDGQEAGKRYLLKITLNESSNGIALQNDATITRYNQALEAKFVLTDAQGVELFHGEQAEQTAYNVVQSPYATLAAQQDSSKRAAQDLAERIRLQLAVWFRQHK
jgi:LPS-assembly lipoprotein